MNIGYEQWHDGISYDLDALDELEGREREEAAQLLIPRAGKDWRDLEALDRVGTPSAISAILKVRQSEDPEMRLRAHHYGPEPSPEEWEQAILQLLPTAEPYAGLTLVMESAVEHPTPAVVAGLWAQVRNPASVNIYHCAEALCLIAGVIESEYDFTYRPLFLRLQEPGTEGREQALKDLEALCAGQAT